MKLLLSALLLAALPAGFAQSPAPSDFDAAGMQISNGQPSQITSIGPQRHCPVFLTAASVDAPARVLPVANTGGFGDGVLKLHFRYQSPLPIKSVSIHAHLRVKTDKYALDAREVDIPFTIAGTKLLDDSREHSIDLDLPPNVYIYGVARVSLNSVTFTTGEVLTPRSPYSCGVNGNANVKIAK